MGSPHKDRSQEKLHELFRGFPDLVQAYLSAALRDKLAASKSDAPLRVLDIGAGTVPYRAAFSDIPHEKLDIYLWDRDSTVHDSSLRAAWLKNDFFDVFPPNNSRIVSTETRDVLRKKFDVILLAASLHELHYDAVVNWGVLGDFHKIFFNYLTKDLLADGGRILIADYGWPKSARADHVWRIRDVQEELTGHADPPWTFLPLTRLQELARDAGLMVLNTSARGLYDQLSKRDLEEKFSGRLTPEQQETLQLRLGFVVSFEQSITRGETSSQSFGSNPLLHRRAVAMVSKKAEVIFQAAPANEQRMAELGRLFTQPYSVLNDRAALWHFVGEMRRLAEQELNEQQVPTPGVFEAWLSVGLSRNSMSKAKQTRFIPRLDLPWNEKHNPCPAGVLSLPNTAAGPISKDLLPGPVTISYRSILELPGTRSIHDWISKLHRNLRRSSVEETSGDARRIRSITIMDASQPAVAAKSLALTWLWGDKTTQAASGHYLVIIGQHSHDEADASPFEIALETRLREIWRDMLGKEYPKQRCLSANYGAFLRGVFRVPKTGGFVSQVQTEEFNRFDAWWESDENKDKFGGINIPRFNTYTTIALGCDGLSLSPPETMMLFLEQAFPPRLLEKIEDEMNDVCRRLGSIETEVHLKETVQQESELEEMKKRDDAVAGFSHQVGHVFGAKSNFPLAEFGLEDTVRNPPTLGDESAWNKLRARAAQIEYAAFLPEAFEEGLIRATEVLENWRIKPSFKSMGVKEYVCTRIWSRLVAPILSVVKEEAASHQAKGRVPLLRGADELPDSNKIPMMKVVDLALFEMFWNAFEKGDFASHQQGVAAVDISCESEARGSVVKIVVSNTYSPGAPNSSVLGRGKGLQYIRSMISGLKRAAQDSSRYGPFAILDFQSAGKDGGNVWQSVLTLPGV